MKKTILLALCLLSCINGMASVKNSPQPYDFIVEGIRYKILNEEEKTVAAAGMNYETGYKGVSITLSSYVSNNGVTYAVTTIGYRAFYFDYFTSFTMPNTVTVIENEAFRMASINYIQLSSQLRYVGDNAFAGVTTVGSYSAAVAATQKLILPPTVEHIGSAAFSGNWFISMDMSRTKITELNATFSGARKMTQVTLPSTVTKIGNSTFSDCEKLTNVIYNNAVITEIGEKAFSGCSSLENFIVPEGVKSIGNYAFLGCSALTTLSLPSTLEEFKAKMVKGTNSFGNDTTRLKEIKLASGNRVFKMVDGMLLNALGTRLIWVPNEVKNLVVPEGVRTIEENAASYCDQLTNIQLPTSLKVIEEYAFQDCSSLEKVDIPFSVNKMGTRSFSNCKNLREINIPVNSMLKEVYVLDVKNILHRCRTFVIPEKCVHANFSMNDLLSAADTLYVMNPLYSVNNAYFVECLNPEAVIVAMEPFATQLRKAKYHKWDGKIKVIDPCPYVLQERLTETYPTKIQYNLQHCMYGTWNEDSTYFNQQFIPYDESVNHKLIGVRFNGQTHSSNSDLLTGLEPDTDYEAQIDYEVDGKQYLYPISFTTSSVLGINYLKTTQTTVTARVFPNDNSDIQLIEYGVIYKGVEYPANEEGNIVFSDLQPNTKMKFDGYYAKSATKTYYPYIANESLVSTTTSDVSRSVVFSNIGSTSLRVKGNLQAGDATVTTYYLTMEENTNNNVWTEINRWNSDNAVVTGLVSGKKYRFTFVVFTSNGGEKKFVTQNITIIPELQLTMQQPQVSKNGITVFTATTNMTEDEQHAGFEWIKNDAPETVAPKQGYAIIYGGMMVGQVQDLSKTYYKVRAFYETLDKQRIYTDWLTFDADEYSTFQPIVHTSPDQQIAETGITIVGYVTSGSETIIEQGFEYWVEGTTGETSKAKLNGQQLITTLTQLTPGTTYVYRVYVTTASGTFYGEEQRFTTPASTAISTLTETDKVTIEGYYDLHGRRINGLNAKGMTIIRTKDGKIQKVLSK